MPSEIEKFKILFWKNWKVQLKRKKWLALQIVAPILCGCFILLVDMGISRKHDEDRKYDAFNITGER